MMAAAALSSCMWRWSAKQAGAVYFLAKRKQAAGLGASTQPQLHRHAWGPGSARCNSNQVVSEEMGIKYVHRIRVGNHWLMGDLTVEGGGADSGPAPKELVMSGLATCTSMTIRMYADRKGWPLQNVRVTVNDNGKAGRVPEGLNVVIDLEGELSTEQREKLLEVSKKCPVKQMLLGNMPHGITTSLGPTKRRL